MVGEVDLLRARHVTRFDCVQAREVTEAKMPAPMLGRLADARLAHWHPLVVRAQRDAAAVRPRALVGLVILRAAGPRVVGRLVVVPSRDQWVHCVHRQRAGVALVLRVALAVVGERHGLVARLVDPVEPATGVGTVAVLAVLVDVVAEVHDDVDVRVVGDRLVAVEVAERVVRTTRDGNHEPVEPADRQRAGPTDRGRDAVCLKPVVEHGAGRQAARHDLDRVILQWRRYRGPAGDDAFHRPIGRDGPADRDLSVVARHACPQNDAICRRVAAGHAVREYRVGE